MKYHYDRSFTGWVRKFLSGPFTLAMIVPLVFLDVCIEIYHHTAFRLLGIPRVRRWDYIRIDRHKLSYLTPAQKVFCAYCGYANGLLPYAAKIAAETEKYWCAIMHRTRPGDSFKSPPHHETFLAYGDRESYERAIQRAKSGARK